DASAFTGECVKLDGQQIAQIDLYSPDLTPTTDKPGWHHLGAGTYTLRFECAGKSSESKGFFPGSTRWPRVFLPTAGLQVLTCGHCRRRTTDGEPVHSQRVIVLLFQAHPS